MTPSMDFKPPTTEQGDTAARLLTDVNGQLHVWHAYPNQEKWDELHAALDTLIAYHRAASAVEAAKACQCAFIFDGEDERDCEQRGWLVPNRCLRCMTLAAAQARLALYEQEAR